jgi:Tfp pilus assembly protein PilF
MSLLLEALKKAEKAKEEAQRRARGDAEPTAEAAPPPPPPEPPTALPEASPRGSAPVRTRDQLPDIRQPLEILEDSPPPKPAPRPEPALAMADEKPAATASPATAPRAAPGKPDAQAGERAAARKVFEAKFKEPNPRLPFYITLGGLGLFAVGTVVYFWIQLRPAPALVNANPQRPADEAPVVAAVASKPPPGASAPAASPGAIPGLPSGPAAAAPATPKPAASAARTPAIPRAEPRLETLRAETPRAEAPRLQAPPRQPTTAQPDISTTRPAPQVHPRIAAGYAAYLAGDLGRARTEYQDALRDEPGNRDALLGLAALDVRAGRLEPAEAAYLRLLQANPRDTHAQAALIALRGGRIDPVAAESRVKSMIADNPGAHVLNFTLGNQLAQQGRWAEAQQEFFKAFTAEPENADFAYNLAVSLDHLRQPKLALEYYRRALSLAQTRGASFDLNAAQARVAQLGG